MVRIWDAVNEVLKCLFRWSASCAADISATSSQNPVRRHITIRQIWTRLAPADTLSLGRGNFIQRPYRGSDVLFYGPDDLFAQRVKLLSKLVRSRAQVLLTFVLVGGQRCLVDGAHRLGVNIFERLPFPCLRNLLSPGRF